MWGWMTGTACPHSGTACCTLSCGTSSGETGPRASPHSQAGSWVLVAATALLGWQKDWANSVAGGAPRSSAAPAGGKESRRLQVWSAGYWRLCVLHSARERGWTVQEHR